MIFTFKNFVARLFNFNIHQIHLFSSENVGYFFIRWTSTDITYTIFNNYNESI